MRVESERGWRVRGWRVRGGEGKGKGMRWEKDTRKRETGR